MTIRQLTLPLLLAFALVVASGCASKGKTGGSEDAMPEVGAVSDADFELNADSDSNKAGGLRTVFFDFNSSRLTSSARESLDSSADVLKANDTVEIQVEGHCDERGGVQYNLALGEKRAKSVRDYLIAQGIPAAKISTISFGKERPVAFGHSEDEWAQNRRGNFVVTAK